jgi:hypothetical protein
MKLVDAIVFSASIAGMLDIAATGLLRRAQGTRFSVLLKFVASGVLGQRAFDGGLGFAFLGLFIHFLFATLWAGIYALISRGATNPAVHPWLYGALYGAAVHIIMSCIFVPLSRAAKRPFTWNSWLTQLAIHIAFVGIPIAVVQASSMQ